MNNAMLYVYDIHIKWKKKNLRGLEHRPFKAISTNSHCLSVLHALPLGYQFHLEIKRNNCIIMSTFEIDFKQPLDHQAYRD